MPKSAAHAVDNGSGMLFAGFAGISSHLELGSRRFAGMSACTRGEVCTVDASVALELHLEICTLFL